MKSDLPFGQTIHAENDLNISGNGANVDCITSGSAEPVKCLWWPSNSIFHNASNDPARLITRKLKIQIKLAQWCS